MCVCAATAGWERYRTAATSGIMRHKCGGSTCSKFSSPRPCATYGRRSADFDEPSRIRRSTSIPRGGTVHMCQPKRAGRGDRSLTTGTLIWINRNKAIKTSANTGRGLDLGRSGLAFWLRTRDLTHRSSMRLLRDQTLYRFVDL